MDQTKYILITGGSGYIGSNTAYYLLQSKSGFHPVCIDLNIERKSKAILKKAGIPLFQGNINDSKLVKEIHKQYPFESVMHFAAYIEAGESVKYPEKFYENNVTNLEIFLATLKELSIKYFIFSSSAAVYGTYETPIEEDYEKKPCNPYGATKLKGEQILEEYAKSTNIKACSLRYFNASGAEESGLLGEDHEPETHLIPKKYKLYKRTNQFTFLEMIMQPKMELVLEITSMLSIWQQVISELLSTP
jgi:UDP-glucose 4-epimerase